MINIKKIAEDNGIPHDNLRKVIAVESGGFGFDKKTGKIIIQFEPHWFKRLFLKWSSNLNAWQNNKVEGQLQEWKAFNDAFSKNPKAAMEATSIGLPQIMGFHWKRLGFSSVGEFWDYMKESEDNQVLAMVKFIKLNKKMYNALITSDWNTFAYYYNGAQYKKFNYAERLKRA